MSDELITADNVSKELLESIFTAAFMDVSHDSDGDIIVKEACRCYVIPRKEHSRIWLMAQFNFKPLVKDSDKLVCANNINKEYIIVRASVVGNLLRFTYDILLDDGITRKALVLIVKRFCSIPHPAVADHGQGIVQ